MTSLHYQITFKIKTYTVLRIGNKHLNKRKKIVFFSLKTWCHQLEGWRHHLKLWFKKFRTRPI